MEHKLKKIALIGFIQLVLLIALQNQQKGSVSFMGTYGFPLGNRTVIVHPPQGSVLITDAEEITRRTNNPAQHAFIIAGDTANAARPIVAVDVLAMGELNDYPKLLKMLEQDTTAIITSKQIGDEFLTVHYLIPQNDVHPTIYSVCRFVKCYPYYLRERADWMNNETIPESVALALSAIEVKK